MYGCSSVCVCVTGKEREGQRQGEWGDGSACNRKQGSSTQQCPSAAGITVPPNMCSVPRCPWTACSHVQSRKDPLWASFLFLVLISLNSTENMLSLANIYWSGSVFLSTLFCQYGRKRQSVFTFWKEDKNINVNTKQIEVKHENSTIRSNILNLNF